MRKLGVFGIVAVFLCLALAGGCSKKSISSGPGSGASGTDGAAYGSAGSGSGSGAGGGGGLDGAQDERPMTEKERAAAQQIEADRIYFGYDSNQLTPEAQAILKQKAQLLQANPGLILLIEGHSDQRGTNEYNLALGERRATAVNDYLVLMGVASSRLSIISYGEEHPAVDGSSESAWAKNRRAQFKVSARG